MPVIPAAGPLAAQAHSLFIVHSSGFKLCPSSTPAHAVAQAKPNGQGGLNKFGGDWLYGLVAAVTFATIVAVVAGVTLAAAASVSHDLYKNVFSKGTVKESTEIRISRIAAVLFGGGSVGLAVLFQQQNVGFLATLPLVIAASVNFPVLLLAIYWPGLARTGAVAGGLTGLILAVVLMLLSPKVWVSTLGHRTAPFPHEYPTLISLSAALLVAFAVSFIDRWYKSRRRSMQR